MCDKLVPDLILSASGFFFFCCEAPADGRAGPDRLKRTQEGSAHGARPVVVEQVLERVRHLLWSCEGVGHSILEFGG